MFLGALLLTEYKKIMQKNEMKNFVCSFILSLLAVVAVSRAFWCTSQRAVYKNDIKPMKVRNISLFRESLPVVVTQVSSLSEEKIAISEEKLDVSALDELTVKEPIKEQENVVVASRQELPQLSVLPESITADSNLTVYAPESAVNTDLSAAEEIMLDTISVSADNDVSKIVENEILQEQNLASQEVLYAPEPSETPESSQKILASLDMPVSLDNASENVDSGIIPIEESSEVLHSNIDILQSANASQIAMLDPNALVDSLEDFDDAEETPIEEINLKQDLWKSLDSENEDSPWVVAESKNVEEDSPWVMARGNKYAKNRAIVEQFADKEIVPSVQESEVSSVQTAKQPETSSVSEIVEPTVDVVDTVDLAPDNKISEEQEALQSDLTIEEPAPEVVSESLSESDLAKEEKVSADALPTTKEGVSTGNLEDKVQNVLNEQTLREVKEAFGPQPLLRPVEHETKLAYQMIENLLIPIPEDIKNDANLSPDLSVAPAPKEKTAQKAAETPLQTKMPVKEEKPNKKTELKDKDKESGLFKSIAGWFSSKSDDSANTSSKKTKKKKSKTGLTFFQSDGSADIEEDSPSIMPAELRLSFQPNRAEISGQTLRWIHAFADNARDNDGVYIEIRIDGTSSFALQQKRLNLLSTILANRGVDFRKINIVFTSREPNSFIIRNIRFKDDEKAIIDGNNGNSYYQPW